MTQAGRQGSPRNSSGRKGPERNAARGAGQAGPQASAARLGSGQRDFPKGGDRPFGDRPHKAPKPREERFVDPDEAPAGQAARPATGGLEVRRQVIGPQARCPASPARQGARHPRARSSPSRGRCSQGLSVARPSAANASARTSAPSASLPASAAPAATCRSPNCTTPTASACRRSWPSRRGLAPRLRRDDRRGPRRSRRPGRHRARCPRRSQDRRHPRGRPPHPAGRKRWSTWCSTSPRASSPPWRIPTAARASATSSATHHGERLFHVGRLDVATEGLLLLTNDGELANRLTHPSYEVPKTYLVQVRGPFPQGDRRAAQGRRGTRRRLRLG